MHRDETRYSSTVAGQYFVLMPILTVVSGKLGMEELA